MDSIIYLCIGIAAGAVGALSSGGGLLSIPLLMFMGVTPVHAIATTRVGSFFGGLSSVFTYSKKNQIQWNYVIPYLAAISAFAGLIGPHLLVEINQELVKQLVGCALVIMSAWLLTSGKYGIESLQRERAHKIIGAIFVFPAMLYAVMFGAGGGAIVINILLLFFGLKIARATATGMAIWIVGTGVASIAYIISGLVVASIAIPLVIGSLIGGYIGAYYVNRSNRHKLKILLGIIVGISGLKILFFS